MSSSLRVESRTEPSAVVLEMHGDVSADGEVEIKGGFADAVAAGSSAVLIDLSDAAYINTSGISVLIEVAMEAKQQGVTLLVSGASPHYKKVFDLVRFTSFVSLYDTEADALGSLA